MPDKSNDYDNCKSDTDAGSCLYWFMEKGKSADFSPAILDFNIFKSADVNGAEEKFNSTRRSLVGWVSTDKGDRPLADEGYDPVYGARPLKRVIQSRLQNPLAGLILEGRVHEGETIMVSANEEGLTINGEVSEAA